jgi:hypothetical protein
VLWALEGRATAVGRRSRRTGETMVKRIIAHAGDFVTGLANDLRQRQGGSGLQAAAKTAKLHYASDSKPGITRVRTPRGFATVVAMEAKSLMRRRWHVSASWQFSRRISNVGLSDPNGHLQAVGSDACGRKQYRYHPRWRQVRDEGNGTMPLMPPSDKRSPTSDRGSFEIGRTSIPRK